MPNRLASRMVGDRLFENLAALPSDAPPPEKPSHMPPDSTSRLKQVFELANGGQLPEAVRLIKVLVEEKADLEGKNISLANLTVLATDWRLVSSLLPPKTNFFLVSGWLNSLGMQRPLNAQGDPIPWFTYPAIDFLEGILHPQWEVFEWGSGNSTLWWAKRVRRITSIEDNGQWYAEIRDRMPANVQLELRTGMDYVEAIDALPDASLDVIVVDGSHRNECARKAATKLKPTGMVVFDNADGANFRAAQSHLAEQGFLRIDFWGLIPSFVYKNCTSIHTRNPATLQSSVFPSDHQSCVGPSCYQVVDQRAREGTTPSR